MDALLKAQRPPLDHPIYVEGLVNALREEFAENWIGPISRASVWSSWEDSSSGEDPIQYIMIEAVGGDGLTYSGAVPVEEMFRGSVFSMVGAGTTSEGFSLYVYKLVQKIFSNVT